MKTISDYKPGDIIVKKHNGIFPEAIQFEMKWDAEKNLKIKWPYDWFGNHVMIVVKYEGKLQILDASKEGSGIKDTLERYINDPTCRHYRFKDLFDEIELNILINQLVTEYGEITKPYDKWGLVCQSVYIHSGRRFWIGLKGEKSRNKPYCSELAAIWINKVYPGVFGARTYKQNINDIELCEVLTIVK